MEPFDRRSGGQPFASRGQPSYRPRPSKSDSHHQTPKAYRVCDGLTAGLILFMAVFTPWAFGTTQPWSIWTMNVCGFVLGGVLITKWLIRWQTGYVPPRWGQDSQPQESELFLTKPAKRDRFTLALAVLTLAVLGYILVGAINARATFVEWQRRFDYHDCINWLPHSYDSSSSWASLWMYSSLACFFWAAHDWLLGKGGSGRRKHRHSHHRHSAAAASSDTADPELHAPKTWTAGDPAAEEEATHRQSRFDVPFRLRLLLWVLCINGSLLALEAILQRLSGTNKLLWLVVPQFDNTPELQFGPYAYRANAASYFNLLWPVCLGFWLALRQAARGTARTGSRIGAGSYLVLLPGAVLMAACPIISTTRGGAIIAVASILIMMGLLLWSTRKESFVFRAGASSLFLVIVAFSAVLGFKQLAVRFKTVFTDQLSNRTVIYENAVKMTHDFRVFGTGAGTFGSLYQLYRAAPDQEWAAYVHDDWLETRITFGWIGFSMILLMLALVLARWFFGPGIGLGAEFIATLWVAIAGCLLHAKFDFPFQVYSILFLFLLLSAILFAVSRPLLKR
jgi:hypothetical protein